MIGVAGRNGSVRHGVPFDELTNLISIRVVYQDKGFGGFPLGPLLVVQVDVLLNTK